MLKTYDTLILENFIDGQEIQVAVLNGKALGAIELKPKENFTIIGKVFKISKNGSCNACQYF